MVMDLRAKELQIFLKSNMKKACILGHYAFGQNAANGQTIKTKILTEALQKHFGQEQIEKIDTHGGLKTLLKAPLHILKALKTSSNVIMLPAHNGVRVYGRFLPLVKNFFKGRKIHYVVIGGWLPEFIKERKGLSKCLKKFDGIYVETSIMKNALEAQGFKNVFVMPNFKDLKALSEDELVYTTCEPYKLCTFSRVMKEKGIEDAVNAVVAINEQRERIVYTLDIYGQIDSSQTKWFEDLRKSFPEYVKYKGVVPFDKSVEVLKDYFALLFPTYYEGEGFAGTLIDSFAAGVPIIASDWKYNSEIVDHGVTGLVYSLCEKQGLDKALMFVLNNTEKINEMKKMCLKKSEVFSIKNIMADFVLRLEK